jgi:hypothetical protein
MTPTSSFCGERQDTPLGVALKWVVSRAGCIHDDAKLRKMVGFCF